LKRALCIVALLLPGCLDWSHFTDGGPPDLGADLGAEMGAIDHDLATCASPRMVCNGICVDVTSDPMNCGGCNAPCTAKNGTNPCIAGQCSPQCDATHVACGAPSDGCDTDDTTDTNCGACRNGCLSPAVCAPKGGSYTCLGCADRGFVQCAGACFDPTSDAMNCGGCGQTCPGGMCVGGYCKSCSFPSLTASLTHMQIGLHETCPYMKPGATVDVTFVGGGWCFHVQCPGGPGPLWVSYQLDVLDDTCSTQAPHCYADTNTGVCSPPATLTSTVTVPANGTVSTQIEMVRCEVCGDGSCDLQSGSITFTAR
jgi:hypothetical protein